MVSLCFPLLEGVMSIIGPFFLGPDEEAGKPGDVELTFLALTLLSPELLFPGEKLDAMTRAKEGNNSTRRF